jgi:hypothetical protein
MRLNYSCPGAFSFSYNRRKPDAGCASGFAFVQIMEEKFYAQIRGKWI